MKPTRTNTGLGISDAPDRSAAVDAIIGKELAHRRRAIGVSRNNFAALLGLSQKRMRQVEAGAGRLDPATLLRAAQILGVRPSDLFRNVASAFAIDLIAVQDMPPAGPGADCVALRARIERIMEKCDDILRIIDLIDAERAS